MLGGCHVQVETPPPSTLVEGAIEASVSFDQTFLAYYTQPSKLPNGPYSGSLEVMPLPSGSAVALGDGAYKATFGESADALYFDRQPAMDVTTGLYVGIFSVWTPRLDASVALTSGYATLGVGTADQAAYIFVDAAEPNVKAPGQVKLVRTGDCAGTSCPVTTLADGVVVTGTRMSLDGRHASYTTQTIAGGVDTRDFFLVSVADGTTTHVASTTIPPQVESINYSLSGFSPDGSLFASVTTSQGVPLQLQVISTATGAPVPWATPPPGTMCTNVAFSDPETLFLGVLDASGGWHLHRSTATEEALFLNASQFFVFNAPQGAGRYLFFSTGPVVAKQPHDLQMMDLASPSMPTVSLAMATFGGIHLSRDVSSLWLVDQFDVTAGTGTLMTASLPAGQLAKVADSVAPSGANFGGGTDHLFYFGAATLASGVANAEGQPLLGWSQGDVHQVDPDALRWDDAPNPPTMYVTADNPLRIYRESLP
jgi:hypothetical protein